MEQGLSLEFFREYNLNGRGHVCFFTYIHHNMARIRHRVAAVREWENGRRKKICLTLKGMGDEDLQLVDVWKSLLVFRHYGEENGFITYNLWNNDVSKKGKGPSEQESIGGP
ncbi:hypothetical protein DM860_013553 [Cuscuta australis]|uniref:Uncharacterized protein n=1 Tax=Cuscuta australis TaxID=267555 RepID=A0A328EAJ2_9ASTE|nr:hypothetical protein DM860_013553 [Cuscuta australis]